MFVQFWTRLKDNPIQKWSSKNKNMSEDDENPNEKFLYLHEIENDVLFPINDGNTKNIYFQCKRKVFLITTWIANF
jgi:hypothetical protein